MPVESRSLRQTLLMWLVLPLLALFFLRGVYNYFYTHRLADHVYDRSLNALTGMLSQQIAQNAAMNRPTLTDEAVRMLNTDDSDTTFYVIRDVGGRPIVGDARIPAPANEQACDENRFVDSMIVHAKVRVACRRIMIDRERYTLQVAETLNKRVKLSRELQAGIFLPQLFIIVLAMFIVWIGVGRGLSPLRRLQADLSDRSHLDLSALRQDGLPAELQPLIQSFNELMARLSSVLDARNRFIADSAHQLRTPLAGLVAQLALIQRQPDGGLAPEAMNVLQQSTARLTRLVNQLLALSRNEQLADSAIELERLDLGSLAAAVSMDWVPRALDKDIDLGFEGPRRSLTIQGDASRLRDLLDNLIDNAVRYTPRGGRITVRVSNESRPVLQVVDSGPGISPDQRERVFERFYSILGTGAQGSGLGLAIVREIARLHGASTQIDAGPDGTGTVVSVTF